MARSNAALEPEIIPAWKTFLQGLFDTGDPGRLADALRHVPAARAKRRKYAPRPARRRDDHRATWLRAHLADVTSGSGIGRPIARVVWGMGEAAATFDGNEWVSGPISLFAAGYFEAFVRVTARALDLGVRKSILTSLVLNVREAIEGTTGQQLVGSYARLTALRAALGETTKKHVQKTRRQRRTAQKQSTQSRRLCTLTKATHARFDKAWTSRAKVDIEIHPYLFMAAQAERHPNWGLGTQRTIATAFLLGWLDSA